jgi:hypothetical protein
MGRELRRPLERAEVEVGRQFLGFLLGAKNQQKRTRLSLLSASLRLSPSLYFLCSRRPLSFLFCLHLLSFFFLQLAAFPLPTALPTTSVHSRCFSFPLVRCSSFPACEDIWRGLACPAGQLYLSYLRHLSSSSLFGRVSGLILGSVRSGSMGPAKGIFCLFCVRGNQAKKIDRTGIDGWMDGRID